MEGRSGISQIEAFDTTDYPTKIAASVKDFNPEDYIDKKEARRMDRFVQFGIAASKKAVDDAKLDMDQTNRDRVGVIVGSGIGGLGTWEEQHRTLLEKGVKRVSPFFIPMMIANMASGHISMMIGARGEYGCRIRMRDRDPLDRRCVQDYSTRRRRRHDLRWRGSDDPPDRDGRILRNARHVHPQ